MVMSRATRRFNVVGVHCAGEVCDVIVGGVLDVKSKTMYEKMMTLWNKADGLRQLLLNEPRGRAAKCQNLIMPPCDPQADAGLIIMEHEEYPPMSGANVIATATVLLETGMVALREPRTSLVIDTPAGLVRVDAKCAGGKCLSAAFENVPAYVHVLDQDINVPGIGTIKVDIAWGGMFYVLVDAASVGMEIKSSNGAELVSLGERIKRAVQEQTNPIHPHNPEIHGVSILQFTGPIFQQGQQKTATNTVVVSPGRLDRSPCGTGTSARLAVLHARGLLKENESFHHRGIVGTEFIGKVAYTTKVGKYPAIVPVVEGSAWITSYKDVVLHPTDPFPDGFRVGDAWYLGESTNKARL